MDLVGKNIRIEIPYWVPSRFSQLVKDKNYLEFFKNAQLIGEFFVFNNGMIRRVSPDSENWKPDLEGGLILSREEPCGKDLIQDIPARRQLLYTSEGTDVGKWYIDNQEYRIIFEKNGNRVVKYSK